MQMSYINLKMLDFDHTEGVPKLNILEIKTNLKTLNLCCTAHQIFMISLSMLLIPKMDID